MYEELLDRTNIVPLLEQVGRERVPEGVTADAARDGDVDDRLADGALDAGLVQVMTALSLVAGGGPYAEGLRSAGIDGSALGVLEPRSGDTTYSRSTVEQMLRDGAQSKPELRDFPAQTLAKVAELQQLMRDRVGYASAPEFEPLITTLTGIRDVMPGAEGSAQGGEAGAAADAAEGDAPRRGGGRSLTGSIESRNDALRAIDMVCEYLERTEPTNPAQLLLRRARKLVNKNFVELVRELAPESLNEVARVMGISAEELSALQGQE